MVRRTLCATEEKWYKLKHLNSRSNISSLRPLRARSVPAVMAAVMAAVKTAVCAPRVGWA